MKFRKILPGNEKLIESVVDFFLSKVLNPVKHAEIIKKCQDNPIAKQNRNHDVLLRLGRLSISDFLYYGVEGYGLKSGVRVILVEMVLDKLCEALILHKEMMFQTTGDRTYTLNEELARYFCERNLVYNMVFDFTYIAYRYRSDVFKILVTGSNGNENIGTGFLFKYKNKQGVLKSLIITNSHVAKYEDGLSVVSLENKTLNHGLIYHAKKLDLSVIEINQEIESSGLYLSTDVEILDEIITIGYPPVATTIDSYQLVHKGEVNSFVQDYWNNDFLLFSAKTSPGNSGGPLLNHMGMVVGVVAQSLEREDENAAGAQPYFSAIKSEDIIEFINSEYDVN